MRVTPTMPWTSDIINSLLDLQERQIFNKVRNQINSLDENRPNFQSIRLTFHPARILMDHALVRVVLLLREHEQLHHEQLTDRVGRREEPTPAPTDLPRQYLLSDPDPRADDEHATHDPHHLDDQHLWCHDLFVYALDFRFWKWDKQLTFIFPPRSLFGNIGQYSVHLFHSTSPLPTAWAETPFQAPNATDPAHDHHIPIHDSISLHPETGTNVRLAGNLDSRWNIFDVIEIGEKNNPIRKRIF